MMKIYYLSMNMYHCWKGRGMDEDVVAMVINRQKIRPLGLLSQFFGGGRKVIAHHTSCVLIFEGAESSSAAFIDGA